MKRVLLIDHTAVMGGGEVALLNLVRCFDRARYVPVVALFSDGPLRGRLEEARVETHVLPAASGVVNARKDSLGGGTLLRGKDVAATVGLVGRLAAFIRHADVALVHTNSLKSDLIGGVAGRLAGVPVVWHVRDRIADDYLPGKIVTLFRLACRVLPTHVIAISQAVRETLGSELDSRRVTRVYDGTLVREKIEPLAATGRAPVVGLIGRISPWKGQDVFVRAAALLGSRWPDARFQIIGSALFGEEAFDRELRQLVEQSGVGGTVEFLGFRQDVNELIPGLDVLVHASTKGEPFGQVVIEAMAAGRPVVATRGGGIPEIVVDGKTGLLVPMGDARAMADAIGSLLSDPARAEAMGRAGRERVEQCFTIAHTAQGVQAVYDRLLGSV